MYRIFIGSVSQNFLSTLTLLWKKKERREKRVSHVLERS